VHAHDAICLGLWVSYFSSDELHAVQGDGTGEDDDAASSVGDCEVVSKAVPGKMDKRKVVTALGDLYGDVFAETPFACGRVSGEDFEINRIAVWGDVCQRAIFGPSNLPIDDEWVWANRAVVDSLATARCAEFVDTPGEALEGRNGGDCLEGDMLRVSEEIVNVHVVAGGIHGQGQGEETSRYWAGDWRRTNQDQDQDQDQGKGQARAREPIATIGVWVVGYQDISGYDGQKDGESIEASRLHGRALTKRKQQRRVWRTGVRVGARASAL
jgi:hypothetical protein